MKVAILVIALFALTAVAQEEQYQPEVEYLDLPARHLSSSFKGIGNIPGSSKPKKATLDGIFNRKVVQVYPRSGNFIPGSKRGGREVEEEFEFIDEPQNYEVHYYIDNLEDLEDFNLPTMSQIKTDLNNIAAGALHAGANIYKGISQAATAVSNAATVIASGKGQSAKVLGTVSDIANGVSIGAGVVSTGSKFIPHPVALGVSAGAGAVSTVAGVVSTATDQLSKGTGIAAQIVRGLASVSNDLSRRAVVASSSLNKAADKIERRTREVEFFVDEPLEFVDVYETVEFVDIDAVEDLNLLDRQQVANGFNKAGKVAGIVSKVTGAVSKVAGKVSSGLNWIGNKIGNKNGSKNGGKELEVVVAEAYLY